jgi:hypothetical protein
VKAGGKLYENGGEIFFGNIAGLSTDYTALGPISQKIVLFLTTAERTSNPTQVIYSVCQTLSISSCTKCISLSFEKLKTVLTFAYIAICVTNTVCFSQHTE